MPDTASAALCFAAAAAGAAAELLTPRRLDDNLPVAAAAGLALAALG